MNSRTGVRSVERASAPRPQVKEGLAPTPEHAFAVLHLDCKTGLPISGDIIALWRPRVP